MLRKNNKLSLFYAAPLVEKPINKTLSISLEYPLLLAVEDQLKSYLSQKNVNLAFSTHQSTLKFEFNIVDPSSFHGADKLFREVLSLLNSYRLTTRDRVETLQKYEEFLVKNKLNEFVVSHKPHKEVGDNTVSGNDHFAF